VTFTSTADSLGRAALRRSDGLEKRFDPSQPAVRLGLLLLACLVPRMIVAWKLPSVCDDGFSYLHIADSLNRGRLDQALAYLNLNIYPVVLSCLHACGLEWTTAGKVWGVLMGTAIAVPLFNWLRRMFDERIATAGVFLYAVHPKLIECSVEPIREATFWLFFVVALDFLWRSCQERRWWQFAAAGVAIALALHTRIEGWFLLAPLAVWGVASWWRSPGTRWRVAGGGLLCLVMTPLLVLVMNVTILAHYPKWEFGRLSALSVVSEWFGAPVTRSTPIPSERPAAPVAAAATVPTAAAPTAVPAPDAQTASVTPVVRPTKSPTSSELRSYLIELVRTLGVPFLVLAAIGWITSFRSLRDPRFALLPVWSTVTLLAIWMQLKHAGEINGRYFLTLAFINAGVAGIGCLAAMQWLRTAANRFPLRLNRFVAAGLVPVCLMTAGWTQAFTSRHNGRRTEVKLGLWARSQSGPIRRAVSDYQAVRPAYFAAGALPAVVTYDEFFNKEYDQDPPDLLVIDPNSFTPRLLPLFLERAHDLGLVPLDQRAFSSVPPKFAIYVRPQQPVEGQVIKAAAAESVVPAQAAASRH
jgi:hypothetical protein